MFFSAINLLVIFGLAFLIWKKQEQPARYLYWPALGMKLLAGIGLGWIYQRYYTSGDTFYFFDQAIEQARMFHDDPVSYLEFMWQDADEEWKGSARSIFFVKIISPFAIITRDNYWITSLWFSFVSFLGAFYLFKTVTRFFEDAGLAAALAFLFFPSVVFWGSGVIKESLGLAALMILSGLYVKGMMNKRPSLGEFVLGIFCFWIVWNLKYYWIALFLPIVTTSLLVHFASLKLKIPSRMKLPFWIILFLVLCLGASLTHPNFYIERFLQVVIENNHAFVAISDPSDLIQFSSLKATWVSIISNSPWALWSGLFRPFFWEADTVLKVVVSLENLLIFTLCVASLSQIPAFLRAPNRLITLSTVVYIVLLCIFLALSTPNLGSLSRYKVGFLPFLIFLIAYKNPLVKTLTSFTIFQKFKKIAN